MTDLEFKNSNPGSVKHGNFINYYQFHPPDNRINLLPQFDFWHSIVDKNLKIHVLDVGCNCGDLTMALSSFLSGVGLDCSILGIDIDPTLITRAKAKNTDNKITFECIDIMTENTTIRDYSQQQNIPKFDMVFCFSITMWIHLNHGDQGLKTFLKKITEISTILIIEPQPWKCYKTALKRVRLGNADFPYFKTLKIRQNIEEEIEKCLSGDNLEKIWESPKTKWDRKIMFFRKDQR